MRTEQLLNSNHFNGRAGFMPKWIILHGTAGGTSAQAIAAYFKSTEGGPAPVSSHYVIGQDGTIVQCVGEEHAAWANGYLSTGHDAWWPTNVNPNLLTISIEHCKPSTDNSDQLTPAQQAASFALIKDVCTRNGIPMRSADASGGITGHFSLDPVNRRDCPGAYPWDELWAFLAQGEQAMQAPSGIPVGWSDDGKTLVAPNGHRVVDGFRAHVLASAWDANNQPIENEVSVGQLELFGGGTNVAGSRQLFRDTMLIYTPAKGVMQSYIGRELQAYYQLVHSQHQQIVQLAAQVQELENKTPEPIVAPPVPPLINVADLKAAIQELIDKSDVVKSVGDALKVAGQRALADIEKV